MTEQTAPREGALAELIAVLEAEARIGEELLQNLRARKEAILAWDSSALLARVDEKETLLGRIAGLENQRDGIVARLAARPREPLRALLAGLPPGPRASALEDLHRRVRTIYSRLRAQERTLAATLEDMLGHLRGALGRGGTNTALLYGASGTVNSAPPRSGILEGKV